MSLQDLVSVTISSSTVSPTRPGFGTPLAAVYHKHYTDIVRFYTSLAGVVSDGFATNEPGYKMASEAFAQNPAPARIAIGRRALAMTQVLDLLLSSSSALDTYAFTLVGWDGVSHPFSVASTGTPATDAATIVTDINNATMSPVVQTPAAQSPAVTLTGTPAANEQIVIVITTGGAVGAAIFKWSNDGGASYTSGVATASTVALGATGLTANFPAGTYVAGGTPSTYVSNSTLGFASASTATVVITQIAGKLIDVQGWNPLGSTSPIIALTDATADPGIATDLAAMQAFAPAGSFYGVALDSNSKAEVTAATAWAEAAGALMLLYNNSDTHCITTATDDIFSTQKALAHARSGGLYSGTALLAYGGMAWLSKTLPSVPGSLTFMYKTLSGVPADNLSESAQLNLNAKNANYYVPVAGINTTINGWDAAGEFLDIVWGTDALTSQVQIDVFSLLANSPKVPYTDLGVDMIKAVVTGDLALFSDPQHQFIAPIPAPTVSAPLVATIAQATRAARVFPSISFSGKLAGAIHSLSIAGVLQP